MGGLAGLVTAVGLVLLAQGLLPGLPLAINPFYLLLALGLAIVIGLLAGLAPARNAARMNPIDALRAE